MHATLNKTVCSPHNTLSRAVELVPVFLLSNREETGPFQQVINFEGLKTKQEIILFFVVMNSSFFAGLKALNDDILLFFPAKDIRTLYLNTVRLTYFFKFSSCLFSINIELWQKQVALSNTPSPNLWDKANFIFNYVFHLGVTCKVIPERGSKP